jgi:invasion protein IalB
VYIYVYNKCNVSRKAKTSCNLERRVLAYNKRRRLSSFLILTKTYAAVYNILPKRVNSPKLPYLLMIT